MNLLKMFPGESGGIPTATQQPLAGLLGNPVTMMGLSLLANNNSKSFGQNLGRAGMQTIGAMQQMQQQKLINDWRKSQQELMQSRVEQAEADRQEKAQQRQDRQQYERDFLAQHPDVDQTLFKLNPQLAMKQAMPQKDNSYYQAIPTPNGLAKFNARTGELELIKIGNGAPVMKSADSPELQGRLAEAKARGAAGYKLNTNIPGKVLTDRQVAEMATGQPRAPMQAQPNNTGYPMQVSPQVQAERDKVRQDILMAERDQYGAGNNPALEQEMREAGIRVPTKAEEAAQVEAAKADAKYNTPEAIKKREMAKKFKQTTAKNVIDAIEGVAKRVDGWSAGTGGNIMRALPFNSDAKDIAADLETVKANFGFDRLQAMRDMSPTGGALGQVAVQELTALQASVANLNAETQSPEQLKRNLDKAKQHYQNWMQTLDGTEQIMPSNELMPAQVKAQPMPDKPSTMTLKRGTVYETPKGILRWNGKAFEDL